MIKFIKKLFINYYDKKERQEWAKVRENSIGGAKPLRQLIDVLSKKRKDIKWKGLISIGDDLIFVIANNEIYISINSFRDIEQLSDEVIYEVDRQLKSGY